MQSKTVRWLCWLCSNGIFWLSIYLTFAKGDVHAAHVVAFCAWTALLLSLTAFSDDCVRAMQTKGGPISPAWLDGPIDLAAVLVLVWFGWGWTATAYLLHIMLSERFRYPLPAVPSPSA